MKEKLSCSEIRKRKIAYALKDLMQTIPFEKITISDISKKSNIHRQTFYYHFQDRYELLDYLLNMELVSNFVEDFSYSNMECECAQIGKCPPLLFLLLFLDCKDCALHSMGDREL
jgi:hypothetical protein